MKFSVVLVTLAICTVYYSEASDYVRKFDLSKNFQNFQTGTEYIGNKISISFDKNVIPGIIQVQDINCDRIPDVTPITDSPYNFTTSSTGLLYFVSADNNACRDKKMVEIMVIKDLAGTFTWDEKSTNELTTFGMKVNQTLPLYFYTPAEGVIEAKNEECELMPNSTADNVWPFYFEAKSIGTKYFISTNAGLCTDKKKIKIVVYDELSQDIRWNADSSTALSSHNIAVGDLVRIYNGRFFKNIMKFDTIIPAKDDNCTSFPPDSFDEMSKVFFQPTEVGTYYFMSGVENSDTDCSDRLKVRFVVTEPSPTVSNSSSSINETYLHIIAAIAIISIAAFL